MSGRCRCQGCHLVVFQAQIEFIWAIYVNSTLLAQVLPIRNRVWKI